MVAITHDHNTLDKVVVGLRTVGLSETLVTDAINAMHNEGILFRERAPEGQGEEAVASTPEPTEQKEESNLVLHARRELELVGEEPETIAGYCRVIQEFADMGHSGGSASVAIPTINALLQFQNLKPLTDDSEEWIQHGPDMWPPDGVYQSKRRPDAFSTDGGKTYTLLDDDQDAETGERPVYTSETKPT